MEHMQVFNYNDSRIRTFELDGDPWFVGKDVAEVLGYRNTKDALIAHVDCEDKRILQRSEIATFKKLDSEDTSAAKFVCDDIPNRGITIVNESGLYSLILSSKLSSAKAFKRWVTSEVLPAIRKHEVYITPAMAEKMLNDPRVMIRVLEELQSERERRIKAENEMLESKPLIDFANHVSAAVGKSSNIYMKTMAKLLCDGGIVIGGNKLFELLRNNKILMADNLPYQQYVDRGYFVVKESTYLKGEDYGVSQTTLVTPKGQMWIFDKIKDWMN